MSTWANFITKKKINNKVKISSITVHMQFFVPSVVQNKKNNMK